MTRSERQIMWSKFLDRLDKRYVGKVYKALRIQYAHAAQLLREGGTNAVRNYLFSEYLNEEIGSVIKGIHLEAGVFMATKTLSALRKEKNQKYRGFGFNEEWARDIQDYFRQYLLEKSVFPISATTRNRILEVLNQGIEQGWGVDEMVRRIENLKQIRGRAEMIVRTETVRAANYGTFLGADKFDFEVEKEWIAINDNRTRATHKHGSGVDGQKKDPEERFSNGLLFPGDPSGPAREVIQCRCSMAWIAKRDKNGRLIPKKSPVRVNRHGNLINVIAMGIQLGAILNEINE